MGILVTLAIIWLAFIVSVVLIYTIGPPARRLLGIRQQVEEAVEEMRQTAALNREQVVDDLQVLEWPIDATISKYQDARRQILPGANDHRWGMKDLTNWLKREVAERSRSLHLRNLFSLIAWNLGLTFVLATSAWLYYQHVQSKTRPQLQVPTPAFQSTFP